VLRAYCDEIGRDQAAIERTLSMKIIIRDTAEEARRAWQRQFDNNTFPPDWRGTIWLGTSEQIAERLARYVALGCGTFIIETPAPYDLETMSRLIEEVKPMLEGGGAPARPG